MPPARAALGDASLLAELARVKDQNKRGDAELTKAVRMRVRGDGGGGGGTGSGGGGSMRAGRVHARLALVGPRVQFLPLAGGDHQQVQGGAGHVHGH